MTFVLSGDPDKNPAPEPVFYVKFKQGADQAAAEKQIRDEEGENNPQPLEITHDGDFMVMRKKGTEPPKVGAEPRAKLFSEALADSDKPVAAVLIFTDVIAKNLEHDVAKGAPPAVATFANDSKWMRIEAALGDAVKAELTIQTADEDAAKRVADAVTGFGDFMKAHAAQMKQAFAQAPPHPQIGPMREMADLAATIAETLKPQQAGTKVTVSADAKVVGAMLKFAVMTQRMVAENAPGAKGGL